MESYMEDALIKVNHVSKSFRTTKQNQGILNAIKHMVKPNYILKKAVDDINFTIKEGEMVGFLGPNGSGKSTTVKMLSGILHPDKGSIEVGDFIPYRDRKKYVSQIGVVFGQKSQLAWDLPVIESFDLLKHIYRIEEKKYQDNLERFVSLLDMGEFLSQPVRQLSLGQRMRADIAASLLHSPKIVFFDEPTIGVDVVGKEKIREFIVELNKTDRITMLFTTHDMRDIEKTCNKIIIIDHGTMIYDGSLASIKERYGNTMKIEVTMDKYQEITNLKDVIIENVSNQGDYKYRFLFDKNKVSLDFLMKEILTTYLVKDFSMIEPDLESIIREIYEGEVILCQANH
ncbi:ABC transporter related [Lachnoclostridium phytofermentans ISDg]|uniref:ABC transporter related n=2 Tax=Lachnoclostridium phytofermentans TaxID=66219 RepID=A9KM15_LACP7|nr:ABC transporter related [Lachnoclostridium phytofermentans ISDg]